MYIYIIYIYRIILVQSTTVPFQYPILARLVVPLSASWYSVILCAGSGPCIGDQQQREEAVVQGGRYTLYAPTRLVFMKKVGDDLELSHQ